MILIDADGCPVVDITLRVAGRHGVKCLILCDSAHLIAREGAETVTLSKGQDSVDFALVNRARSGDIVVTQDYGLAAMCLARGAIPIRQDGFVYTDQNIDALLATRHLNKKQMRGGGRVKGPKKRTPEQDAAFERALEALIRANCEKDADIAPGDQASE